MAKTDVTLTDADRAILRHIQRDGRMTNQALAEATSMSASACWRRVQALEDSGVITGYRAEVDPVRAGLRFGALVAVTLSRATPGADQRFAEIAAERPEILQCFATAGRADYALRVACEDVSHFNTFLAEVLRVEPAIASAETSVVLDVLKDDSALPL